jgi:hypothetical protein
MTIVEITDGMLRAARSLCSQRVRTTPARAWGDESRPQLVMPARWKPDLAQARWRALEAAAKAMRAARLATSGRAGGNSLTRFDAGRWRGRYSKTLSVAYSLAKAILGSKASL